VTYFELIITLKISFLGNIINTEPSEFDIFPCSESYSIVGFLTCDITKLSFRRIDICKSTKKFWLVQSTFQAYQLSFICLDYPKVCYLIINVNLCSFVKQWNRIFGLIYKISKGFNEFETSCICIHFVFDCEFLILCLNDSNTYIHFIRPLYWFSNILLFFLIKQHKHSCIRFTFRYLDNAFIKILIYLTLNESILLIFNQIYMCTYLNLIFVYFWFFLYWFFFLLFLLFLFIFSFGFLFLCFIYKVTMLYQSVIHLATSEYCYFGCILFIFFFVRAFILESSFFSGVFNF